MMKAIEAAQAHFEQLGRQHIEVPEWGTDGHPLIVYWSPMTIADRRRIFKPDRPIDERLAIDVVILKAEDDRGGKLFDVIADEPLLMGKVEANVLRRVATAILAVPTVEQATKNSEATQS